MTQEERQLLLQDLCARLPYGVKMQVTLDLSYDTSYNSVEQNCDFVATLYAINIDGDPTDIRIHHENDDIANYLNERFTDSPDILEGFIPYLRPMSSMTEQEKNDLRNEHIKDEQLFTQCIAKSKQGDNTMRGKVIPHFAADWCNKNHLDYRGLIPMGLALEAPKDMYKI